MDTTRIGNENPVVYLSLTSDESFLHPIASHLMSRQPSPGPLTDAELIGRSRTGDHRSFTALVRRYEQLVFGYAFKVCRHKEKAEEVLQDTFVNVYRKLAQFDGRSKFSTWLYTIVTNNCRMKRRRRKVDKAALPLGERRDETLDRDEGRADQTIATWHESPLHTYMSRELRELLDKAIEKLPPDYRVVFILRDVEAQSAEETAKILNISVPAVKSRLRRARVFLREQLNGYMTS